MVEEADAGHAHGDAVLVASLGDGLVLDASPGLCHVRDPELGGVVDGIPEGKEGVA